MKKSSAKDKAPGRLEDVFRQQFDKAEVTPPADLWKRLEHDLDVADKNTYHKGMLRYRNIAAAALLLLLATAALLTRNLLQQPETNTNLAINKGPEIEQNGNADKQAQVNNSANSGTEINRKTGTTTTSESIALNTEPTFDENNAGGQNKAEKAVSEKANADFIYNDPENVNQPAIAARVEKNAPNRPVFKPGTANQNPAAIAMNTKTLKADGIETPYKPANTASSVKSGSVSQPGSVEPTRVFASKEYESVNQTGTEKEVQKAEGNGLVDQNNQLLANTNTVKKTDTEGISGGQDGNATPVKSNQEPGNTAAITAKADDEPAGNNTAALAIAKPETAEPDTSKQQLNQLASLNDEPKDKPRPENPELKTSKWMLLASATPQLFNQNIGLRPEGSSKADQAVAAIGQNATFENALREYEENTRSSLSYQFQVGIGYRLRPKWIVQTGLGYVKNQAQTATSMSINSASMTSLSPDPIEVQPVFSAVLFAGMDSSSANVHSVPSYTVRYHYQNLQVPLLLTYEGSRKDWLYQVSGGVAANWLLASEVTTGEMKNSKAMPSQATASNSNKVFNTFMPQALLSAKAGYRINQTWNILAGPSVAYGFKPMVQEKEVVTTMSMPSGRTGSAISEQKKPYTIGLTMQVSYNLGVKK